MNKKQGFILLTFLLGVFLGAIDQNIISPALTTITNEFQTTPQLSVWTVTAYGLVYAVSMPLMGKLADRYGRKKVFILGMSIFAVGSLLCGLAQNIYTLIIARGLQAIGGGGIFPIAVAEIGLAFPVEKRGRALGLVGATFGLASIVAPILGTAIISYLSWPWIFYINIPIALLIIIIASFLEEREGQEPKPMDFSGAFFVSLVILFVLLGLSNLKQGPLFETFFTPEVFGFLITGILMVFPLIYIEKRASDPIIKLEYFQNRNLVLIYIISIMTGMVMMSMIFIPTFGENLLGYPPERAGFLIAPLALASFVAAPVGGRILDIIGAKRTILLGFSFYAIGAFLISSLAANLHSLIITSIVMGLGMGFVVGTPLNYLVMNEVNSSETSSAIAVMSVIRSIGNTVGPTVMAGILVLDPVSGFSRMYFFTAIVALIGIGLTMGLRSKAKLYS